MAIYDIHIGDFSEDGHGRSALYYLEIDDAIAEADLRENYRRNSDLLNFSPSDFAAAYEDAVLPQAMYDRLITAGYQDIATAAFDGEDRIFDPDQADNTYRPAAGGFYLNTDSMCRIIAFYLTHTPAGDIPWQRYHVPTKTLIGWGGVNYDRPGKHGTVGVGYGLFYS